MSDLLVTVVTIDEVLPHPNADKLEIVRFGGWQIVSGKGNYTSGQTAIHVPPDAMVPRVLAEQWGVAQYLSWKKDAAKGRVRAIKLRSAPSYGFLAPNDANVELGTNLADALEIEKYEEPVSGGSGQMSSNHPFFHIYTDIQNLRNFPDQLAYGEPLILTEKLHGTNSRVGWVASNTPEGGSVLEKVVGTHKTQRKTEECGVYGLPFELYGDSLEKMCNRIMIEILNPSGDPFLSVLFFGEIFGPGVQDLHYGMDGKKWRMFDIAVNGNYLPWTYVRELAEEFDVPMVPHMTPGFYTFEELCELAEGKSVLSPDQIKEGLVVRPMYEMTWGNGTLDPNPKRMIFKIISSDYLTRKNGTEHH
jgi:RNA ligase (TIGR02306 family)